jgi:hypothetical protein
MRYSAPGFFLQFKPVWVGDFLDLETRPKNQNFDGIGLKIAFFNLKRSSQVRLKILSH